MSKKYTIDDNANFARKFYADDLSNRKFESCLDACQKCIVVKNFISDIVYNNYLPLIVASVCKSINNKAFNIGGFKQALAKELYQQVFVETVVLTKDKNGKEKEKIKRVNILNDLTPSMLDRCIQDVVTHYINQITGKIYLLSFEYLGIVDHYVYYTRNTKKHKAGEIKSVVYKTKDENGNPINPFATKLANVLTYLCRYGNEDIMNYIYSNYEKAEDTKKSLYDDIIYCVNKFGLDRLLRLAVSKRDRLIRKINYKTLSIAGNSRRSEILVYNKNRNSEYNAFVRLSWFNGEDIWLPIRYSSLFYGDIKQYNKKAPNLRYILKVDLETHTVCVILSEIKQRKYINANLKYDDICGVDCNIKHNMFVVFTGKKFLYYDYDRELLKHYAKFILHIDKLKQKDHNYVMGKKTLRKKLSMERSLIGKERETMVKMCKDLIQLGIRHVVFENLNRSFGRTNSTSDEFYGLNYNRLMSIVHFSSLKDEFMHIALNYDICVSFVHAAYTSKQCSVCGCIDDENRQDQENFCCVNDSQHHMNADENAAVNIYKRVNEVVLR